MSHCEMEYKKRPCNAFRNPCVFHFVTNNNGQCVSFITTTLQKDDAHFSLCLQLLAARARKPPRNATTRARISPERSALQPFRIHDLRALLSWATAYLFLVCRIHQDIDWRVFFRVLWYSSAPIDLLMQMYFQRVIALLSDTSQAIDSISDQFCPKEFCDWKRTSVRYD